MNISIPDQKKIIEFYGEEDRTTVVMEELSELIKAVSKYKRYVLNSEKYKKDHRHDAHEIRENLKEEMADTLICIRIMQDITGISDDEIEKEIKKKNIRNVMAKMDETDEIMEKAEEVK